MHEFVTPAQNAKKVELEIKGQSPIPMTQDEHGKWRVTVPEAGPGTQYKYMIDGDAFPDAFSRYQPEGPHGWSEVVDLSYNFTPFKAPDLADTVFYEVHVGTYTPEGTFKSLQEKISYIKSLGVNRVQIMPLAEASGKRGWGYDGVELFAVNHNYGTPRDLQDLVEEFHKNGIAVSLDVVYNHVGYEGNYNNKYIAFNKSPATHADFDPEKDKTPWGDKVNYDGEGSDAVNEMVIKNVMMWLKDYNIDGLRLDAMDNIECTAPVHTLQLITTTANNLAHETGRHIIITGETHQNIPRFIQSIDEGGYGLHAQYVTDPHYATSALTETDPYPDPNLKDFGRIADLAKTYVNNGIYFDGQYSTHHECIHGEPYGDAASPQRMIKHNQNHDEIGNREKGNRLSDFDVQKIEAALLLTGPYVPFVFQGEEYAAKTNFLYFTDHTDPDVARETVLGRARDVAKARGCPPEEVPNCQDEKAFTDSKLDWSELQLDQGVEMGNWFRALMTLRHELKLGHAQSVEVCYDEDQKWIAVKNGNVTTVANFSPEPQLVPELHGRNVLLSSKPEYAVDQESGNLLIAPKSVVVLIPQSVAFVEDKVLAAAGGAAVMREQNPSNRELERIYALT